MQKKLGAYILQEYFHNDREVTWLPEYNSKWIFYVTESDKDIREVGRNYTVKSSSKFEDGFLGDVGCIKIGNFWIALMDGNNPYDVRWHLKMVRHGWERIPKKYYEMKVEVA